jgi:hypothetical protein
MDGISLLGDALKQQSLENGSNWLNKIKQELETGYGGYLGKWRRE